MEFVDGMEKWKRRQDNQRPTSEVMEAEKLQTVDTSDRRKSKL